MVYHNEIQLSFDVEAFMPNNGVEPASFAHNTSIEVSHFVDAPLASTSALSEEKSFFLAHVQSHLTIIEKRETRIQELLTLVSTTWDRINDVSEEIRLLNTQYPTTSRPNNDGNSLCVTSSLLLPTLQSKVELGFDVLAADVLHEVQVYPAGRVVYGETFNEAKMGEFLKSRISDAEGEEPGAWARSVKELATKLKARGKKSMVPQAS
jgi:kinetochore protein Spc7/SPC105